MRSRNIYRKEIWVCDAIKSNLVLTLFSRRMKLLKQLFLKTTHLPNISIFKFCDYCLEKYENDQTVFHVSGCNLFPNAKADTSSYSLTSIINIWGWATWADAWKRYDINMTSWKSQNKIAFLKQWCTTKQQVKDMRSMFDLHCENKDPWTWDYQWVYTCWSNNGLSIMPSKNLVQNLGMGPLSTHTKYDTQQNPYPASIEELSFPLTNKSRTRDLDFERKYFKNTKLSLIRKIKGFLKNIYEYLFFS